MNMMISYQELVRTFPKAQNKKPTKPLDSNSDVKTWQVVVEIDGQQGVIMTDRAPDEAGYVWVKLEIGEISVEASELRVKGMRSL
ncbi:transcriptional repressor KorB C-terminal beta-barrel domain-containing protein [Klebsiella pneumoniae]|uniref:transcriptional repressor KorB C-terminal beta-barrel domain-containing protein n=1 Tax=Klebsiella pneumoniae TaxID=573 RepID=UPI0034E98502